MEVEARMTGCLLAWVLLNQKGIFKNNSDAKYTKTIFKIKEFKIEKCIKFQNY